MYAEDDTKNNRKYFLYNIIGTGNIIQKVCYLVNSKQELRKPKTTRNFHWPYPPNLATNVTIFYIYFTIYICR